MTLKIVKNNDKLTKSKKTSTIFIRVRNLAWYEEKNGEKKVIIISAG